MRFLVDNQLPLALAKHLILRGHDATHVLDAGLDDASDSEIWKHATENSLVLISKDEDFARRASQPGSTVQVVWVRLGNCRTAALLAAFDSLLSEMQGALEAGNRVVEIR